MSARNVSRKGLRKKVIYVSLENTDDVFEFLSNEKKDGKEEQYFTNIIAGTKLKTSLSYKVDIKANTPIKVLKIKGDYAQIKVTSITATLVRDTDINDNVKPFNSNKLYTIKNLTTVNKAFNGLATKDATFNTKQVKAPRNWRTNLNRTVTFYPNGYGKVIWIEKTSISKIAEKIKKEAGIITSIIPDYFLTEEQKYETVEREAKTGEKTTLYVDVCKAYIEVPFRTDVEEVTVEKEKVVDLRKFKKAKDDKKDLWYKVVLDDTTSSQCVAVKGWVKEKDLDKFSAYDWQKFGFKDLDAGNEYIYSVKDLCKATDSTDFVTEIWDKTIDTDGNKVLDILELIRAFSKPEIAQKLSRLVCKHKNEWSYTMDEIKPEVKELYDFGIQLEEVTAEKQKLETERDDSLAKMETKIENLMWWDEASKKTYTAPVKEEDKTKTSSTKRPSMLPEGTVVEEIPQKDVVPLDNKTTAVKPDAKPTKDSIPTTSTTAAPTPETKVEEKEVPPERMFPSTNIVHHFHPIAWVEQMRLIFEKQTGECYCNRDFTVEEVTRIIKRLRKNENLSGNSILSHDNCKITNKSFDKLTEELNKTIAKYKISQCIQKIHFITQLYHESARFTTGLEFDNGNYYNPNGGHPEAKNNGNIQSGDGPRYKGRGFMQLTWRNTQIKYLKYASKNTEGKLKGKTDSELELRSNNYQKYISDDLGYAMDSAGWFWSNYKKIEFSKKENKNRYAHIINKPLNEVALNEDKYLSLISKFINGGKKGIKKRANYYQILKSVFRYEVDCINNIASSKEEVNQSLPPWLKVAFEEYNTHLGYIEEEKTLKNRIEKVYFGSTQNKSLKYTDPWCAAFINYCYLKGGLSYKNLTGIQVRAFEWGPFNNKFLITKRKNIGGWKEGEDYGKPFLGALAIYSGSHVGFVVGKNTRGKIVLLGGNQNGVIGNTNVGGDESVCFSSYPANKILFYMKPKGFIVPPEIDEENLPIINISNPTETFASLR